MSLFFPRTEQRVMQPWSDFAHDGPSESRATSRATYLAPVFAAIRHIVDYVSSLPVEAYREAGEQRTKAKNPPLIKALNGRYGVGAGAWFGQAAYGLAVDGNAVGEIKKWDAYGRPEVVSWLRRYQWSFDEEVRQWYINGRIAKPSEVVHIPWMVPPGYVLGLSPIEHFAATISAGLSAQEYADVRRGGGLPPTTMKNTSQIVDPKNAEVIEGRLAARFSQGRPFVFGKDWEFGTVSIPPNHAHFIETMKMTANQTAAIYGLDPTEIGGEAANSLTYTNAEMRQIDRAANMRPYIVRLEQGISRILAEDVHIQLDIDSTMRVDAKVRAEVLGMQVADGRRSINEARIVDDLPPVPGGDFHNIPAPTRKPEAKETK